jgi:hypothetical protein
LPKYLIINYSVMSCPTTQSFMLMFVLWKATCPKVYHEWGASV